MTFNQKDERIAKLWRRGLSIEQIARKIGMPTGAGTQRVKEGLKRKGLT